MLYLLYIRIMEEPEIPQKTPIVADVDAGTYFWCACGKSANQPFCDGAHNGTSFTPIRVTIEEDKKVAWCTCKHSENKPFCDGSHKKL